MNPKNVLLIENSLLDAILIKESLQQNENFCHVNLFEDGFEAIVHIESLLKNKKNEIPDLIIANEDLILINGVNILSKISKLNNFYIPVIIMTSSGSEIQPHFNRHTCCYISKPLEIKEFLKVFREIKYYWLSLVN
ncbi:response regulator [Arenibacter sp. F26102]|uniref:response regulator n=1 Tax=Arenibacter sp. F26102 TaxID=2926416 RepID=UPI001FF69385|nr:response regulator [Arenibacter sp. F26102]MCK0145374.1 response regulator [Arenibacter sp. F26102]